MTRFGRPGERRRGGGPSGAAGGSGGLPAVDDLASFLTDPVGDPAGMDVNGDGMVDVADLVPVINALSGLP